LSKEGFVGEVKKASKGKMKGLKITLRYNNEVPAMEGFKRISKPGQRIYQGFADIRKVRGGFGISIISTSKGLMTNKDARYKKLGGEVICKVW
jgi:small subunit ribosomal protein S8